MPCLIKESHLHRQIHELLSNMGVKFIGYSRFGTRSTFTKGAPDFLFCREGKAVGLEVKTTKGKLSPDQLQCHADMVADGWYLFTVRSLDEVLFVIEHL